MLSPPRPLHAMSRHVEVTTTVQAPLWSLQMVLKQQRALPGSTDEPSEPTLEQHHAMLPPPRSPSFRTPAATLTSARAVLPRRPKRRQCRRPCLWSLHMALKQHRALPRSTDEPSEPTREQHDATTPPPCSPRRTATPLALEHTLQNDVPRPRLGTLPSDARA